MTPEEERKLLLQLVSGEISKEQYEAKRYKARMDALRAGLPSNTVNKPDPQLKKATEKRSPGIIDRFGEPPQDKEEEPAPYVPPQGDYESQVPPEAQEEDIPWWKEEGYDSPDEAFKEGASPPQEETETPQGQSQLLLRQLQMKDHCTGVDTIVVLGLHQQR